MILAAIFSLITGSMILAGMNFWRVKAGYQWFLAISIALTSWVLLISSYTPFPRIIPLMSWESGKLFSSSPTLLLDEYSWGFGVAIVTIFLGILLTDIARVREINPNTWAAGMALAGAGLLAIFSGNPLTLLFGWAIIDIAETTALLRQVSDSSHRERVVVAFSIKVVGILIVVSAMIRSSSIVEALSFMDIPSEIGGYLILAAGLRLGVLPPYQLFLKEPPLRRGYGTLVRLVPVAASLILLARVASVGAPPLWEPYVLVIAALAGLYGAFSWISAEDELAGRPFWILGMAAFAVASATRGDPSASKIWGLGLLYSGSVLFLYSARNKWFSVFPLLGWLGFSALPFSPTWHGLGLFSGWNLALSGVFILTQALMVWGYVRYVFREGYHQDEIERWGWIIYPIGLGMIVLTHFGMGIFLGETSPPEGPVVSTLWWGGTFAFSLAALLWLLSRRKPSFIPRFGSTLSKLFSFNWLYRTFWWLYQSLSTLVARAALVLEGEGGILWAVLILILLMATIVQRSGGG
jgi:hypothetical protein